MRHNIANTTLSLCHGGLREVWEVEHLEVTLVEDKIAYCRSVGVILLIIIEDVRCYVMFCLHELCFEAGKLVI